ncbi:beta strand repeat-containing protein [Fontivita pretiosa]|uniref:beta strand repeat-containing protein n=1 Tax=Fontivita pretiosa TaxID=2989684 RepID=UPI003D175A72
MKRRSRWMVMVGTILSSGGPFAYTQVSIGPGLLVTENFDSLGSAQTATLPSGWRFGSSTDFSTGFSLQTTQSAGTTGTGSITSTSAGGYYNWGTGTNATATDRAVGFLTSSSFTSPRHLFAQLSNNTGSTITSLSIAFDLEKYRQGTRAVDITFFSGTDGLNWTPIAAGNHSYPADSVNTVVVNGPSVVSKSGIVVSGLSIAPGGSYYLRWTYTGVGGSTNGQGLGVDNFSLTATVLIPPQTRTWDGGGASDDFGDAANWDSGPPATGDAIVFAGAIRTTPNMEANYSLNSVRFASGASTFSVGLGANTLTLTGTGGITNQSDNVQTITGGTIEVDVAQTWSTTGSGGMIVASAVDLNSNTLTVTPAASTVITLSGKISGASAGITKTGPGELVLGHSGNDYSGNTTITAGTLTISADGNLGDAANDVQLNGGALRSTADVTLGAGRTISGSGFLDAVANTTMSIAGPLAGGSLNLSGDGTVAMTSASISVATLLFSNDGTLVLSAGDLGNSGGTVALVSTITAATARITGSGAVNLGNGGAISVQTGGTLQIDHLKSGNSFNTKTGGGTLLLSGDNPNLRSLRLGLAGTSPADGGTISISTNGALGSGSFLFNNGALHASAPVVLANDVSIGGGQLGGGAVFDGSIEITGGISLFRPAGTTLQHKITLTPGSQVTFTGPLGLATGSGTSTGLSVLGAGELILAAGSNPITQTITIDGPTLVLNGTLDTASVVVAAAGRLGGTGTANGSVLVQGTISPGTSVGQLTSGAQTWDAGGTYLFEMSDATGGAGTGWDHLQVSALSVIATTGNRFTIKLSALSPPANFDSSQPGQWVILTASGGINPFDLMTLMIDKTDFAGDDDEGAWWLSASSTQLRLHYVPEPAAGGVILLAGIMMSRLPRRRRD